MSPVLTRAALALLLALPAAPVLAQSPPDFSGTWALDLARSNFGQLPTPESRVDVIQHTEPRLVIKRTTVANGTQSVVDITYAVDGQPHQNTAGGSPISSVLRWDGATLVVTSTVTTPQGDLEIVDRMSLSADGRTLTQQRTLNIQGQELAQTMVFTRRE